MLAATRHRQQLPVCTLEDMCKIRDAVFDDGRYQEEGVGAGIKVVGHLPPTSLWLAVNGIRAFSPVAPLIPCALGSG